MFKSSVHVSIHGSSCAFVGCSPGKSGKDPPTDKDAILSDADSSPTAKIDIVLASS